MPRKLSKEESKKLRETKKSGGVRKEIRFGKEIEALKKGEELLIEHHEWDMKTTMLAYYYGKFAKGVAETDREIKYESVEGGLLITKLK
jgi:hypothetical protein